MYFRLSDGSTCIIFYLRSFINYIKNSSPLSVLRKLTNFCVHHELKPSVLFNTIPNLFLQRYGFYNNSQANFRPASRAIATVCTTCLKIIVRKIMHGISLTRIVFQKLEAQVQTQVCIKRRLRGNLILCLWVTFVA